MPNTALHYQTITELAAQLQSRQLSPVEVTQALLQRIEQLDGRLQSYATVMTDHAITAARAAEQDISAGSYRGPDVLLRRSGSVYGMICHDRGIALQAPVEL